MHGSNGKGGAEGDKAPVHGNSGKNGVSRNGREKSFPFHLVVWKQDRSLLLLRLMLPAAWKNNRGNWRRYCKWHHDSYKPFYPFGYLLSVVLEWDGIFGFFTIIYRSITIYVVKELLFGRYPLWLGSRISCSDSSFVPVSLNAA